MEVSSRYWKISQISLTQQRTGYEYRSLPTAQSFFQSNFSDSSTTQASIQAALFSYFLAQRSANVPTQQAQAGLCLRCDVSYPILQACRRLGRVYSSNQQFTYYDLLPFVLNDDGKDLIVLDSDGKTQLKLDSSGKPQATKFKLFTVEVLSTFNPDSASSMSLNNWAFLQTNRHPELKNFLSEFGFQHLSNWALLNRVRPKQLEQISERDRHLIEAFHTVYRRDRRQQQRANRCPDPNEAQLKEMIELLQPQGIRLNPYQLIQTLKQVAKQLRQHDVWQSRELLEIFDEETGKYDLRVDLPTNAPNESDTEEQEFLDFLHSQLPVALAQAIEETIQAQIAYLQKSKRYAPFAACLIPGLQLYYCKGLSLKDIAPQLGMSSWDQARRIFNLGALLTNARRLMVEKLLKPILNKAQAKGFASVPPEPGYLRTLIEQIEVFVDAEIFEEAASEIKAGKNRLMDSVYAQQLKHYIEKTV